MPHAEIPCWLLQKQEVEPFAMHASMEFGGLPAKRARLREAGLWYDPPEYYDSGGFIELAHLASPGRPPGLDNWTDSHMLAFHMSSMRAQLKQVGPHLWDFSGVLVRLRRSFWVCW